MHISSRKFWQNFFDLFRIRKKTIHWGTVYDSITKQPIDPAIVELQDFLTKEVRQTAITDLWGKYGFLAPRGDYLINVRRSNYAFPSEKIKGGKDGIYAHVYHGEQIPVRSKWELVSLNIPMDPVREDFNQEVKKLYARIHPWRENLLRWIFNSLFWGGFAVSVISYLSDRSIVKTIVLAFFVLILVLRLLLPPRPLTGRVFLAETGEPLGPVDIELSIPGELGIVVIKTRSTPNGKFFLKAREGKFTLKVIDPFKKRILAEGTATLGPDGLLNSDISI